VYFTDWRYSEDLDFTAERDMSETELHKALGEWYVRVEQVSQIRLTTKMLRKPNGYARIRTQYIGPLAYPGMIFFDLSFDEPICLNPVSKLVLTQPFPSEGQAVLAYQPEELLAEKIRSVLERGKSRDYYDVWRLLKEQSSLFDFNLTGRVLTEKLKHKKLDFTESKDFLPADRVALEQYWKSELEQQLAKLPSLTNVLSETEKMLNDYIIVEMKGKE
jgi:predicted nucleotidyltransferase component of viral defense system